MLTARKPADGLHGVEDGVVRLLHFRPVQIFEKPSTARRRKHLIQCTRFSQGFKALLEFSSHPLELFVCVSGHLGLFSLELVNLMRCRQMLQLEPIQFFGAALQLFL